MPGIEARFGFLYQDSYLIYRIVPFLISRQRASVGTQDPRPLTLGIESPLYNTREWDILLLEHDHLEVIEVKSGQVTKQDRKAFWLRLRAELKAAGPNSSRVVPSLVLGSPHAVTLMNVWEALSTFNGEDSKLLGTLPTEAPSVVRTFVELVQEALYWMCSAPGKHVDGPPETPVDLQTAIGALSRFQVKKMPAKQLFDYLEQTLPLLVPSVRPDSISQQWIGFLTKRATDPSVQRRQFTLDEFLHEVELLRLYHDYQPDALKKIRELLDCSNLCLDKWASKFSSSGLPEYSLTDVQPTLASIDWTKPHGAWVLLGAPGQGKSKSLSMIHDRLSAESGSYNLLPLQAEDISNELAPANVHAFKQALLIHADLSRLEGKRFLLIVDALDQIYDTNRRHLLVTTLNQLSQHPAARIIMTCRDTVWEDSGATKIAPAWDVVKLELWQEAVVESILARSSIQRTISTGVQALLRTPFYLDILVRTFGNNPCMTAALQTRHGLLQEYWKQLVLEEDARTRMGVLQAACCSIAVGHTSWEVPYGIDERTIAHFISIGLLVPLSNGRLSFRHQLLRDFALGRWAAAEQTAEGIEEKIQRIESTTIRFGAQRALIEGFQQGDESSDEPVSLPEYLNGVDPSSQEEVARILGDLIPTPQLDPNMWSRVELVETFAERLIHSALLHKNWAWAHRIGMWPASKLWAEKQVWIDSAAIGSLRNFIEKMPDAPERATLSNVLHTWLNVDRFQNFLSEPSTHNLRDSITTIIKHKMPAEALDFIEEMSQRADVDFLIRGTLWVCLYERLLVPLPVPQEERLLSLFCKIVGITETPSGENAFSRDFWYSISYVGMYLDDLFFGNGPNHPRPLLLYRTDIGLTLFLKWIGALTKAKQTEAYSKQAAQEQLDFLRSFLQFVEHHAIAAVFDETHLLRISNEFLSLADPETNAAFLYLYHDSPIESLFQSVKELLLDEALYDNDIQNKMHVPLSGLLQKAWGRFTPSNRVQFFQMIQTLADKKKHETGYFYRLLGKLPMEQVPQPVQAIYESDRNQYEARFAKPKTPSPTVISLPGVHSVALSQFEQCTKALSDAGSNNHAALMRTCIEHASIVLPELLASIESLLSQPWPLGRLALILSKRQSALEWMPAATPSIDDETLRQMSELAVRVLGKASSCVDAATAPALHVLGEALAYPAAHQIEGALDLLFERVETARLSKDLLIWEKVYHALSTCPWLHDHPTWKAFLSDAVYSEEFMINQHHYYRAVPLLTVLEDDQIVRIILYYFNKTLPLSMAACIGSLLGKQVLAPAWKNKQSASKVLLDDLLLSRQVPPALEDRKNRSEFLWGLVAGVTKEARIRVRETDLASYVLPALHRTWQALQEVKDIDPKTGTIPFMKSLFLLLYDHDHDLPSEVLHIWWKEIAPLCEKMMQEGTSKDAFFTFLYLEVMPFPVDEILSIAHACVQRLQHNPSDLLIPGLFPWKQAIETIVQTLYSIADRRCQTTKQFNRACDLLYHLTAKPIRNEHAEMMLAKLRSI